jgi:hypothetical protein
VQRDDPNKKVWLVAVDSSGAVYLQPQVTFDFTLRSCRPETGWSVSTISSYPLDVFLAAGMSPEINNQIEALLDQGIGNVTDLFARDQLSILSQVCTLARDDPPSTTSWECG